MSAVLATMDESAREYDVYECQACGSLGVAGSTPTCCDEEMAAVEVALPYESPDVETIAGEVFGISGTELDVCRHLMDEEEATVGDLSDRIGRDRSVVARHLNHLAELGVAEKEPRDLPRGGRKFVYSPIPVDQMRRQFALGLHGWLAEALSGVDELKRETIEAMAEERAERDKGTVGGVSWVLEKVLGTNRSS